MGSESGRAEQVLPLFVLRGLDGKGGVKVKVKRVQGQNVGGTVTL